MFDRPLSIIEAPSNLGLQPPPSSEEPGVRHMPAALKAAGLAEALGVQRVARWPAPAYSPKRDAETGLRNARAIRSYSVTLAAAVEEVLDAGEFPVVVGGDCSILLGSMLALRRRGMYGLVYIDGHTDFLTPTTSQTGGAAGMDLALVTGRGPELLTAIEGLKPFVRDSNVVVIGNRDIEDGQSYSARDIFQTAINLYPLEQIRASGIAQVAEESLRRLQSQPEGIDGYWIHVDVDVLDSAIMPAVDSPQPGGLTYAELSELLRRVLASPLAVGLQITIFDPDLDPDGVYAQALKAAIVAGFRHTSEEID